MKIINRTIIICMFMCAVMCGIRCYAEDDYIIKISGDAAELFEEKGCKPLIPEIGLYTTDSIPSGIDYDYIEPNYSAELFGTYDYSGYISELYEVRITELASLWDIGAYGSGVKIGVVDSGCAADAALPYTEGRNYIDGSDDCDDNMGHGTSVCGMAAARYGKSGTIGPAHKADIVPLKFIDRDDGGNTLGGRASHLIKAMLGAVDDYGCDIVNVSAGIWEESQSLEEAVEYILSKGVLIVAAAGNDKGSAYCYPASCDGVVSVASVDSNKEHAYFSDYNDRVTIAAPGSNVTLVSNEGGLRMSSGTSFSSPYVAGIAACILSADPELTPSQVTDILTATAQDLGDPGYDIYYGHGLVDCSAISERLAGDEDYYVSGLDICSEDGLYEVRIKRRSGLDAPVGIWRAEYGNTARDIRIDPMEFNGDICVMRYDKPENSELRYFIWDSFAGMVPIC